MFGAFGSSRRIEMLQDHLERQRLVIQELAGRLGIDPDQVDPLALDAEERRLLGAGQQVAAIKHLRERTGLGLAEAKRAVDRAKQTSDDTDQPT